MAGFLVSRMRSGLLCRRRRASSSSRSAWASKCAISAARCAARSSALAQAVQLEPHVLAFLQAELLPQPAHHQDHLGVDVGAGRSRAPRRRAGGTGDSGPSAAARGGTSRPSSTGAAGRCRARCARSSRARCRRWPRGAASARRRSSRRAKEYISFSTMSVTSPRPRTNSAVGSTIGVQQVLVAVARPAPCAPRPRTTATAPSRAGVVLARDLPWQDVVHALHRGKPRCGVDGRGCRLRSAITRTPPTA